MVIQKMNAMKIPPFLFHGTPADIDDIMQAGLIAQVGEWTKSVLGKLHDVSAPAVWLTEKVGMAYYYAINSHIPLHYYGTIIVIDTSGLDPAKFIHVQEGYCYPATAEGDDDYSTHYAYAGDIPPEAIIDSLYVDGRDADSFDRAVDMIGSKYGGMPSFIESPDDEEV